MRDVLRYFWHCAGLRGDESCVATGVFGEGWKLDTAQKTMR
jgi:hypothetical protein